MFWKMLRHIFVPSNGLDEHNIKGTFYPKAPLAPLYLYVSFLLDVIKAVVMLGDLTCNSTMHI